jgi:hypothetical protein
MFPIFEMIYKLNGNGRDYKCYLMENSQGDDVGNFYVKEEKIVTGAEIETARESSRLTTNPEQ